MASDPPRDPVVDAQVERALEPYRSLLPPEALAEMREFLEDALTTHPVAVRLIDRLRPRAPVVESGERVRDGADASDSDEEGREAGGGGPR